MNLTIILISYVNGKVYPQKLNFFKLILTKKIIIIKGFPLIFYSSKNSQEKKGINKSYYNEFEANIVFEYVKKIIKETDIKQENIGIISPYKNQVKLML